MWRDDVFCLVAVAAMLPGVAGCNLPHTCRIGEDVYEAGGGFRPEDCGSCECTGEYDQLVCARPASCWETCHPLAPEHLCDPELCRWGIPEGDRTGVCFPAQECDQACECERHAMVIAGSLEEVSWCGVQCSGGFIENHSCRNAYGRLPAACCDREYLCESTGGVWHPRACAHFSCGEEPTPCEHPVGGCDCGNDSSYAPTVGCRPFLCRRY